MVLIKIVPILNYGIWASLRAQKNHNRPTDQANAVSEGGNRRVREMKSLYNKYIMSKLHQISVSLTQGQKEKLARAYRNKEAVSIRLKHSSLSGTDVLMVPMNTVKRVAKHRNMGVGVQITISKYNIRKQTGSGIFSAVLPALRAVAPAIGKTLGLTTLAGAASEGASQIIKKYQVRVQEVVLL